MDKEIFLYEADNFYRKMREDPNQDPQFAAAAHAAFKQKGMLHIPQTRLTKNLPHLTITDESRMATKQIRATID